MLSVLKERQSLSKSHSTFIKRGCENYILVDPGILPANQFVKKNMLRENFKKA